MQHEAEEDAASLRERAVALRNLGSSMVSRHVWSFISFIVETTHCRRLQVDKTYDKAFVGHSVAVAELLHGAAAAFGDAANIAMDSFAHADALSMKGATLILAGKSEAAVVACQEAAKLNPTHARALFNLGAALEATSRRATEPLAAFEVAASVASAVSAPTGAFAKMAAGAATDLAGEVQGHLRWFEGENCTTYDAVSGRWRAIIDQCVNITVNEMKRKEGASTSSTTHGDSYDAWARIEEENSVALLPSGVSLRCVASHVVASWNTAITSNYCRRYDRRLFIVAQAATGKSMVLSQFGLAVVRTQLQRNDRASVDHCVLPLKIPLVTLAGMMRSQPLAEDEAAGGLGVVMRQYLFEFEKLTPSRVDCLERMLTRGAVLLLLDGLDEATDQIERVLCWVDEMLAAYPRLRVVLSSRPVRGVDQGSLESRGFRILQLEPLTALQVGCP